MPNPVIGFPVCMLGLTASRARSMMAVGPVGWWCRGLGGAQWSARSGPFGPRVPC